MKSQLEALREHAPSILVTGLSAAFGVSLISITTVLAQVIRNAHLDSSTLTFILSFISFVFIAIALYVGALVTSNTFSTIIAGRVRTIALLRLIGSSAAAQRRSIAREGLAVGVVGSVLGVLVGIVLPLCLVPIGISVQMIPRGSYTYVEPLMFLPAVAVVFTTVGASWVGSRRVLTVSPINAIGTANESSMSEELGRTGRNVVALVLFLLGGVLLVAGVVVGLVSPLGVFIGLIGGIASFSGIVLGAHVIMPRALRIIGRIFGASATARLARENAVRYPERSARTTIGLVIGVTLITTFAV